MPCVTISHPHTRPHLSDPGPRQAGGELEDPFTRLKAWLHFLYIEVLYSSPVLLKLAGMKFRKKFIADENSCIHSNVAQIILIVEYIPFHMVKTVF